MSQLVLARQFLVNHRHSAIWFFAMLCCFPVRASEIILLDGRQSIVDLRPWLFLIEGGHSLKVNDVLDSIPVQHPYEFEFSVSNTTAEKVIYQLVLGGGSVFADWVSVNGVIYSFPRDHLKIEIEGNSILSIRFRLPELDRMSKDRLLPQLLTPNDFEKKENGGKRIQPLFIGIFSFMVLFNLFYFVISGWRVYLKYALYIFLSLIFFSHHFGFLQLLFPKIANTSNNLIWILSSIIAPTYVNFISDFGEFRKLNLKAYHTFRYAVWFKLIQLPVEVLLWIYGFGFIHTQQYLTAILMVEVSMTLFGFYYLAISKGLLAKVIVVASLILFAGSILGQINPFQHIDRGIIIETGTLIEIIIFSMTLAIKTKEMDNKRLKATEQLLVQTLENIKIQEKISAQLELLVHERTAKLEIRNKENETLLAEIHHRVKNNLQIISGLINLKAGQSTSPETNEVLCQLNGRIFSMGLVHEKLYQNKGIQTVRLNEYLGELGSHLLCSFEEKDHPVSLKLNCEQVEINLGRALACGLITNELVTNSVKYAFTAEQEDRQIAIGLMLVGNTLALHISDNGNSEKPMFANFKKSFGLRFVDQLVITKLGGEWSVRVENGLCFTITFSL
jgi:two-component sensor histidine kinase